MEIKEGKSFRRPILFLVALLALLQGGAAASTETAPQLADLDLTVSGQDTSVTLSKSDLKTDRVTVQADARIKDLLRSRAIVPDGDALSAVYLLNPDVRDVNQLEAGTVLALPAVPRGALPEGDLVQLNLVPGTKRELEQVSRLLEQIAQVSRLGPERVGTPAERLKMSESLKQIQGFLGDVNAQAVERQAALSPEMLGQSLDGARMVQETLDRALRPEGRWTAEDRQLIAGVAEDMTLKAHNFQEVRDAGKVAMRWRDVRVVVAVVQLPGQAPVSDLRVHYAPEALVGKATAIRSFPGFSPQVAKRLIEADYVFWAAAPGSSQPVTERFKQQVRRAQGDEITVQIAVLPRPEGGS